MLVKQEESMDLQLAPGVCWRNDFIVAGSRCSDTLWSRQLRSFAVVPFSRQRACRESLVWWVRSKRWSFLRSWHWCSCRNQLLTWLSAAEAPGPLDVLRSLECLDWQEVGWVLYQTRPTLYPQCWSWVQSRTWFGVAYANLWGVVHMEKWRENLLLLSKQCHFLRRCRRFVSGALFSTKVHISQIPYGSSILSVNFLFLSWIYFRSLPS